MAAYQWRSWATWLLKSISIIWVINAALIAVFSLLGFDLASLIFSGFLSKITLLETGIAFLFAGAIAFSGSILPSKAKEYAKKTEEKWSMDKLRRGEKRANRYIVLAVILFAESLFISIFGF